MKSINKMINEIKPRELFLIDGFGAWVSAFILGLVIPNFDEIFKLPPLVLGVLAIIPCFFAFYSITYYYKFNKNWRFFLKIIVIANLLYCFLTAGLMLYYFQSLSIFDLIYFILEIVVILILVFVEWKVARN